MADEPKTPPTEDPKPKGTPPVEDDDPDGFDVNERASMRSLYKALKDPDTALELVESLARKAGLLDKKEGNKEDKKATEKELGRLTKKLKTSLGDKYDAFSDKVGPILDDAIKEYLDEHFSKTETSSAQKEWKGEVDKFMETHELTSKIEKKMQELMEDSPPNHKSATFNAQRYLTRKYKEACEELDIEPPTAKKKRRDDDDGIPGIVDRTRPQKVTLDDAIEAAVKGIRFK